MPSFKRSRVAPLVFLILALVFPLTLGAQTPATNGSAPADILAVVGDVTITREGFQAELKNLDPRPNSEVQQVNPKQFLKELVDLRLLEQESSKAEGLDAKKIAEDTHRATSVMLSQSFLHDLFQQASQNMSSGQIPLAKPEYLFHMHQMTLPSLEAAKKAKDEVAAGKAFAEVARQVSQDGFKDRGGDRGFLGFGEMSPPIAQVVEKLGENAVSDPIEEASNSVLLIKFSEKQLAPSSEPPEDKSDLRNMPPDFHQAAFERIMENLSASMSVKMDDAVLKLLDKPNLTEEERNQVLLTVGSEAVKLAELIEDIKQIPDFVREQILSGPGMKDFIKQFTFREVIRVYSEQHFAELCQKFPNAPKRAERETRIRHFLSQKLKDIQVNDDDIKAYYSQNLFKFSQQAARRAHHILVDQEDKAKALMERIAKGESFEEIAKVESKCPSKKNGGDLGMFSKGQMVPEFEAALDKAEIGKVMGPVKTNFGFHVIRLDERKDSGTKPLEEVKDAIRQELLPEKQRLAFEKIMLDLRQKYPVKEFPEKL